MACWSAENATKAYLKALRMGKRGKEPDVAEFISAMAAGNNAQLMVIACAAIAGSTTLAMVAAAHQTGGRVVCILTGHDKLKPSQIALGHYVHFVEFVIGKAQTLLLNEFKGADFVLIDCNLDDHNEVSLVAQKGVNHGGGLVVGYNALGQGQWLSEFNTHFLPIGEGLLVSRIGAGAGGGRFGGGGGGGGGKKSHWVVKVDEGTGEEHVYRIKTSTQRREIEA
ncbi:hypothetical protein CsSME_00024131 [Camellia sinensis var. sinensis]